MTLYEEQLSTCELFSDFIKEHKPDLVYHAYEALLAYEGTLNVEYDLYVVFFVDYDEHDKPIFAVSAILNEWQPIEINDRVRKFTEDKVYPHDSHAHIEFD